MHDDATDWNFFGEERAASFIECERHVVMMLRTIRRPRLRWCSRAKFFPEQGARFRCSCGHSDETALRRRLDCEQSTQRKHPRELLGPLRLTHNEDVWGHWGVITSPFVHDSCRFRLLLSVTRFLPPQCAVGTRHAVIHALAVGLGNIDRGGEKERLPRGAGESSRRSQRNVADHTVERR